MPRAETGEFDGDLSKGISLPTSNVGQTPDTSYSFSSCHVLLAHVVLAALFSFVIFVAGVAGSPRRLLSPLVEPSIVFVACVRRRRKDLYHPHPGNPSSISRILPRTRPSGPGDAQIGSLPQV